ncbi:MAG: hypothetical protein SFU53_00060 [Terrimicrobiaceae bacterium]|nr:hypothetical protein [Terrimicrobiaceae bacterium]
MRRFVSALAVFVFVWAGPAAGEPTAAQAASEQPGSEVRFVDRVAEIQESPAGTLFINFGGRFPAERLTAVIMRQTRSRFPGVENWTGRVVRVRGELTEHRGFRRVILRERGQIVALGRPPSASRVLD